MGNSSIETMCQFYLENNKVFLPDIDMGVPGQVMTDLAHVAMSSPDYIELIISSTGGITNGGFAIAQFIEFELDVPVHARVLDRCHSAATYPLLCCAKRTANELTSFVIHRQTASIRLEHSTGFDAEVDGWKADNARTHQRQIRFYSKKLNLSEGEAEELLNRGSTSTNNTIGATEALKLGIITDMLELSPA